MGNSLPIMLKTMINRTWEREDFDKCEELILEMWKTKMKRRADDYVRLAEIDSKKPKDKRVKRPHDHTFEYAREE